jgi:hypothetical protein
LPLRREARSRVDLSTGEPLNSSVRRFNSAANSAAIPLLHQVAELARIGRKNNSLSSGFAAKTGVKSRFSLHFSLDQEFRPL